MFYLSRVSKRTNFYLLMIIFLIFLICYRKVPFIFFEQDEIKVFGLVISEGSRLLIRGLGSNYLSHFTPITNALNYFIYSIFNLNYWAYNVLGLTIHFLNGFLIYKIATKFVSITSSYIAIIVFLTTAISSQLVMWPLVSISTLSLTVSLFIWLKLLNHGKDNRPVKIFIEGLLISLLFLMAVLIVEYSLGLVLFIPIAVSLLFKRDNLKEKFLFLTPFIFSVAIYILLRIAPIIFSNSISTVIFSPNRIFLSKSVLLLPLRYLGESFFSQSLILATLNFISKYFYQLDPLEIELFPFEFLATLLGLAVFSVGLLVYRRNKIDIINKKYFLLSFLFIILSSVPYVFVPKQAANLSIVPPRYLYFGIAGASLYASYFFEKARNSKNVLLRLLVMLFLILLIGTGIIENNKISNSLYHIGSIRKDILTIIKREYPQLKEKTIFYTESDSSFYGLSEEEMVMPFQSGFGQTLLVSYYQTEKFPSEFFGEDFLWDIKSQGYREIGGRGFGYFRDFVLMAEKVKEKVIPFQSVIAFRYDSDDRKVEDITIEVRGRLNGYLARKREIKVDSMLLSTSTNPKDINLAKDGRRETFWDSKLPYANLQSLEISLKSKTKIAEIQIDSYNNKDQNEVGYKVSLLGDDGVWHQVFYSKRYPPNKDGIVNLYFEPLTSSRVKIGQVGYHKFAPWVIHELKIYETVN